MELSLSPNTKRKTTSYKEKFEGENIAKFLTGEYSFKATSGKGTKKGGKTVRSKVKSAPVKATKISPLEQPDGMIDVLSKILSFMQKSFDDDVKSRELLKNYQEENALEASKRHKALLDVLKTLRPVNTQEEKTAEKIEQQTGSTTPSIIETILESFGGARDGVGLLKRVGKFFLTNPIAKRLLAGATIMQLLSYSSNAGMTQEEETALLEKARAKGFIPDAPDKKINNKTGEYWKIKDPEKAKAFALDEFNAPLTIKYMGDDGDKKNYLKRMGVPEDELDRMFPKLSAPKVKTPVNLEKPNNEQVKLKMAHESAVKAGNAASSTPVIPEIETGQQILTKSTENVLSPLLETLNENIVTTVNNAMNSNAGGEAPFSPVPFVRNQEPTFMRMIYNSTRLVNQ
jgi:hypothetical protein